ncbi:MAG: OmpA family protein [Flavobacteriales bacterium]|nr:OmpA family protein [Flavobacteriales bacterium]
MTPERGKYPVLRSIAVIAVIFVSLIGHSQQYEIIPLKINSKDADFSATFLGNDLVFVSARARVDLSFDDDSLTQFYTDLYITKQKTDGSFTNPEVIKGAVNTDFNEGHCTFTRDGRWMYYTGNLKKSLDNKIDRTSEFKLGIFIAENVGGHWIPRGEYPFNSTNGKYSNAHPSLSENDSILYFCSNMPGGKGNSDIYRSRWVNGQWTEPENLGGEVNSKGNEFFPFISESGTLYFSTDARNDAEGMDIYFSEETDGEFQEPERLNNTINSEYDEFAYQEKRGTNIGCFSSNRVEEQDDVFMFKKFYDNMNECQENYQANFCYHFYDMELAKLENVPIKYEWNLGDGTMIMADSIDYCYKAAGEYHVTLNVVDTLTKMVFKKVSETEISILQADRPFIHSHDTLYQNGYFECKVEFTAFNQFPVKHIKWELDDGSTYHGETFKHQFSTPGMHQIKCGVTGEKKKGGIVPFVCVYKNVWCAPADQSTPGTDVLACCDQIKYSKREMTATDKLASKDGILPAMHEIVIASSKTKLPKSSPMLNIRDVKIKETLTDSGYIYTVAEKATWQELIPLYATLKAAGVENMYAIETIQGGATKPTAANKNDVALSNKDHNNTTTTKDKSEGLVEQNSANTAVNSDHDTTNDHASTQQPDINATIATTGEEKNADHTASNSTTTNNMVDPMPASTDSTFHANAGLNNANNTGHNPASSATNSSTSTTSESEVNSNNAAQAVTSNHSNTGLNVNGEPPKDIKTSESNTVQHNDLDPTKNSAQPERKLYRIVLFTSERQLSFNDIQFKGITSEINELRRGHEYAYTILGVPAEKDLNKRLEELHAAGLTDAKAESFDLSNLKNELNRKGFFLEQGDADRYNIEFSKLSDIKFEYNSAEIKPESYKVLNYIASMLILEEDFTLKIDAHTCSVGGDEFNKKLSEQRARAVMDYFIKKGIDAERLKPQGFGLARPFTTNESEMGRAANRRVEFTVVYSIKK